ncbi:hypothetical protein [Fibrivirga algicola]|uniref:DUF3060 domain-containing protein n=1 Tax=Fibrivirga algicola TaxID=2950420 RepID=A0ABX0QAS0_9BACT|nr:hypothetical protein [Fibrivirga algicola]NID09370.1 hypothetical protein [Fibrivirga algicola]
MKKQAEEQATEPVYVDTLISSNADSGVVVIKTDRPDGSQVRVSLPGQTIKATVNGGQIWVTGTSGHTVHIVGVEAIAD